VVAELALSLRETHGARLMAASPVYFAAKMLSGPPEPPYNGRFLPGPHHLQWDKLVTQHDRVCILASRGLGKTFFFSEAYAIWRAIYRPGKLTFILSAASAQAEEVLQHIKEEVESNPKLRWLLPSRVARKGSSWNKSQVIFSNGSRIVTAGFGTKKRGLHPDCIIVDDGLTDESAYSPTVRRKTNNYFFTAITNMVNPGGQIITVGTPFAIKDLYGELKANPAYVHRVFPAIKDGIPLFPQRFNLQYLQDKLAEIGSIRFGQEIECVPMSDDASLFPMHLFQHERVEMKQLKLGMPYDFWADAGVELYMGVDFALSSGVGADYMVIFVMGVDAAGVRYWVDIERHKGMPYQQQLSLINKMARKYEVGLAVLEANQAQRIFGDELINQTDLPIKKYNTGVEKHSLSKGIPSLRVLFENYKMRIPRGDRHSIEMTDIVIEELHNWTYVDGRLENIGEHDDTSMGMLMSNIAVKSGAFSASFGTEETKAARQQAEKGVLTNAMVPEEPVQPALEEAEGDDVSYDMFGNPVYGDPEHADVGETTPF
jgi:hypothetical protein